MASPIIWVIIAILIFCVISIIFPGIYYFFFYNPSPPKATTPPSGGQTPPSGGQTPPSGGQTPPSGPPSGPGPGQLPPPSGPAPIGTVTTPPGGGPGVQPTVSPAGAPGTTPQEETTGATGASGTAPSGASCTLHTDCIGWGPSSTAAACCNGVCTNKVVDWAGVGYCPDVCQDAPSPLGKPGTCNSGYHWPRQAGEPCDTHAACSGWVAGKAGTLGCCNGVCTTLLADYAGIGYCPSECKDAPSPLGGTCRNITSGTCDTSAKCSGTSYNAPGSSGCCQGYHWPRKAGEPCDTHAACDGWVAGKAGTLGCCNGVCTTLLADWANVGYCPSECKDAPAPLGGPCGRGYTWPRSLGQPCDTGAACANSDVGTGPGTQCCNGICTQKVKDWAGAYYCPADCKDAPAPLGGPCGRGYTWPRSLGQPCDTGSACAGSDLGTGPGTQCCGGVCTQKKKDWAGAYYCPADCVGSFAGRPGTC